MTTAFAPDLAARPERLRRRASAGWRPRETECVAAGRSSIVSATGLGRRRRPNKFHGSGLSLFEPPGMFSVTKSGCAPAAPLKITFSTRRCAAMRDEDGRMGGVRSRGRGLGLITTAFARDRPGYGPVAGKNKVRARGRGWRFAASAGPAWVFRWRRARSRCCPWRRCGRRLALSCGSRPTCCLRAYTSGEVNVDQRPRIVRLQSSGAKLFAGVDVACLAAPARPRVGIDRRDGKARVASSCAVVGR